MTDAAQNWYSDDNATLGDRLVAAREAAGLSTEKLASQLGVKLTTLEAWENDRKEPRANRLQTLAGLLGVSLRWLLTGVGEGPDDPDAAESLPPGAAALLAELRSVRAQMARCTVRIGEIEKQLRTAMTG